MCQGPALIPFPLSPQQEGMTALMWGAQNGHAPVVEMLLAASADKDLQSNVRDSITTPSLSQPVTQGEYESYKALPSSCRPPHYPTNRKE